MRTKGFTLIELIVVMALFGVLSVVASGYLVNVIQASNRTLVENEVRQEGTKIVQDISTEVRRSGCVFFSGSTLTISDADVTSAGASCAGGNVTTYTVSSGVISKNGQQINSPKVKVQKCTSCGSGCGSGFTVSPAAVETNSAITIGLDLTQGGTSTRSDFCGKVSLTTTITPRNSSY